MTLSECARQTVIAHNDPSHVRDRVLRLFEQHHIPANILVSLPSLEGIKRAVAMQMGVALLPRRCAESEIARGELVALADAGDPAAPSGAAGVPARRRTIARLGRVSRRRSRTKEEERTQTASRSVNVRSPRPGTASFAADGVSPLVAVEQQPCRVPRAGHQRVADVRRHATPCTRQPPGARTCPPSRSIAQTRSPGSRSTSVHQRLDVRRARRSRTAAQSSASCRRRSRRTTRRRPRWIPSAAAPAARARATIRTRSCAFTSRIDAP